MPDLFLDPCPPDRDPLACNELLAKIVYLSVLPQGPKPNYIDVGTSKVAYLRVRMRVQTWSCGFEVFTVGTDGETRYIEKWDFPHQVAYRSGPCTGILTGNVDQDGARLAVSETAKDVVEFLKHFHSRLLRVDQ